jgi:hypothetical protein
VNLLKIGTFFIVTVVFISGCRTSRPLSNYDDMAPAAISKDSLLSIMPDYREELQTLTGKGRALVSEPGGSERVTVDFSSNRQKSLLTIRTAIGVEGGQILIEPDSLLIYNKVDKIAQKVSARQSDISSVGSIASLNMLDLFNFRIDERSIDRILDGEDHFIVLLNNQTVIEVDKSEGVVHRVDRSRSDGSVPYRLIEYEGYALINGFQLPRKITIFSEDGESRAIFLVQDLRVNGKLPELSIQLPDDISIYRP